MTQEPSVVIVTSACLTVSLILVGCHLIQSWQAPQKFAGHFRRTHVIVIYS